MLTRKLSMGREKEGTSERKRDEAAGPTSPFKGDAIVKISKESAP